MPSDGPPETPTKKGQEINQLICKLNLKWGLRLLIKVDKESPSEVVAPESRAEKIYRKVQYLFFQRKEALNWACQRFEEHAAQQRSEWVSKPLAATDTLPRRPSGDSLLRKGIGLQGQRLPKSKVEALEGTLLRFLIEAADPKLIRSLSFSLLLLQINLHAKATSTDGNSNTNGRTELQAYLSLARNLPVGLAPSNPAHPTLPDFEPSSSYIFNPDHDTADFMQDIAMTDMQITYPTLRLDASLPRLRADVEGGPGEAEEIYSTPPSTPPKKGTSEAQIGTHPLKEEYEQSEDNLYIQETDAVKLPTPGSGGKKQPRSDVFVVPERIIRSTQEQLQKIYRVHHVEPSITDTRLSFSTVSSSPSNWSTTPEPSTTITTPNTSFYVDSADMSFTNISYDEPTVRLNRDVSTKSRLIRDEEGYLMTVPDAMEIDTKYPPRVGQWSMEAVQDLKESRVPQTFGPVCADPFKDNLVTMTPFSKIHYPSISRG
jgi:hypothetical protein